MYDRKNQKPASEEIRIQKKNNTRIDEQKGLENRGRGNMAASNLVIRHVHVDVVFFAIAVARVREGVLVEFSVHTDR